MYTFLTFFILGITLGQIDTQSELWGIAVVGCLPHCLNNSRF